MKSDFSPSRRAWNVIMTAVVWAAAVLVIALTVGVIGLVLVRGHPPHQLGIPFHHRQRPERH